MLGIHAVRVRMQQVGKHFARLGLFALGLDCITPKFDSFRFLRLCHGHQSTWIFLVGVGLFTPRLDDFAALFQQSRLDVVCHGFLKVGAHPVSATVLTNRLRFLATKSYMLRICTSRDGFCSLRVFHVVKVFHAI